MIRSIGWPVIVIISSLGVALAVVGDIGASFRPLLAFWFLLICPGMAFVGLLHLKEHLTELTLAVALSLTLDTLVAEVMALNHVWSAKWGLFGLICLSLGGIALQLIAALDQFSRQDRSSLW